MAGRKPVKEKVVPLTIYVHPTTIEFLGGRDKLRNNISLMITNTFRASEIKDFISYCETCMKINPFPGVDPFFNIAFYFNAWQEYIKPSSNKNIESKKK